MSSLTQVIVSPTGTRTPLMVEVPVQPALDGPFLVTSTKEFLWVNRKFANNTVRAAVRKAPIAFLFRDALYKVERRSEEEGWGSTHPPTAEGLMGAVKHLSEYGMEEVEILHGPDFDGKLFPENLPHYEVEWVPADWAVVLPLDKAYVGTCFDFGEGQISLVLHNASRAVGIVAPTSPEK